MERVQGLRIPGMEFIRPLGEGGQAEVFLFNQAMPRRQVAVKVLRESLASTAMRSRFLDEANVMAQLEHPHIVAIYSAGVTEQNRPFLVMQYLPQGNLADRVRRERLSVARLLSISIAIGSALEAAHQAGILHRDVKPHNILLNAYGSPALGDFGIAARARESSSKASYSPRWAPPEALMPDQPLTVASDIYSLGATMWHLLAGFSPFEVAAEAGPQALDEAILHQVPWSTGRPDVPGSLESLIAQMLQKNPAQRPATALLVVRRLQAIEGELGFAPTVAPVQEPNGPGARAAITLQGGPVADATRVRSPHPLTDWGSGAGAAESFGDTVVYVAPVQQTQPPAYAGPTPIGYPRFPELPVGCQEGSKKVVFGIVGGVVGLIVLGLVAFLGLRSLPGTAAAAASPSPVRKATASATPPSSTAPASTSPTGRRAAVTHVDDRVSLAGEPSDLTFDASTGAVMVATGKGRSVAAVDPDTGTIRQVTTLGGETYGVAVGGVDGALYAANLTGDSVAILDASSLNPVADPISVGQRPFRLATSTSLNLLFTANGDASVSIVDTETNDFESQVAVGEGPAGMAMDEAAGLLYVTNRKSGTVSVVDVASASVPGTPIRVGNWPFRVAVDSQAGRAYVVNAHGGTMSVIDTTTREVETVTVGDGPCGVVVDDQAGVVYVANSSSDNVFVVDVSSLEVIQEIPVGDGPTGIALNPSSGDVYVANAYSHNIAVLRA